MVGNQGNSTGSICSLISAHVDQKFISDPKFLNRFDSPSPDLGWVSVYHELRSKSCRALRCPTSHGGITGTCKFASFRSAQIAC